MKFLNYEFKNINFTCILKDEIFCDKLEFLGDGIINYFIISWLYKKFSSEKNLGQIARAKSILISKENLCSIVEKLNFLPSITKNKSKKKKSDILEIFFGAVYVDSNYSIQEVEKVYAQYIEPLLTNLLKDKSLFDFKSILQSYAQKMFKYLPKYSIENHIISDDKTHIFTVKLSLSSYYVIFKGRSVLEAQKHASRFLVNMFGIDIEKFY